MNKSPLKHPTRGRDRTRICISHIEGWFPNDEIGQLLRQYASYPQQYLTRASSIPIANIPAFKAALVDLCQRNHYSFREANPELSPMRNTTYVTLQVGLGEEIIVSPIDKGDDLNRKLIELGCVETPQTERTVGVRDF